MKVLKHDTGAQDEQAVSLGDASDGLEEALASHALALEMTRFLVSRDGDNLEIVEQDFEITHFVFAVEPESLEIAKKRPQCGVVHLHRGAV